MKQVSFFNILTRSFIAFAVTLSPLSPAFAAASNLAEVENHDSSPAPQSAQIIQFEPEMPPAMVVQNKFEISSPDAKETDAYSYEAIAITTKTPEQYDATVKWINRQMDAAQAKKLKYQFYNMVPVSAEGPQLAKFFTQDIAPQHLSHTVSLPMEPDAKLPSWSSRIFNRLGQLAFDAAKDSKAFVQKHGSRLNTAMADRKRRATLTLAKNEIWYENTFVMARLLINGGYATYSFYHSTNDLGASLIAGGLLMGGISAVLQKKIKIMNRYLSGRDRLTVKLENKLLGFAEHRNGEPLSDIEAASITERVKKISGVTKWVTLETPFLVAPNLVLAAFGYNLMGATVSAAVAHLLSVLIVSMAAQSQFDTGNSARKELDVRQSGQDPDQLLIANYQESLRSLITSTSCVAGVCMAMGSVNPYVTVAGYALLVGLTVKGWFYRRSVSKDTALFNCEEKLKSRQANDANRPNESVIEPKVFDKAG